MEQESWMTVSDHSKVYVKKWFKQNEQPKAIVQIAHGMAEHIERYNDFATFLVNNNIFVYGNDHRGHGKTGEQQGRFGYFSDTNGFRRVATDIYELTNHIKSEYPNTPLFLFGHSMGSFLARKYIQDYSLLIDGVILSGTGYHTKVTTQLAKRLAEKLSPKEKSNLLNKLVFQAYNKKIPRHETEFDWLTRDKQAVQQYIADPYSGFVPTARFFYDLMDGLQMIQQKEANQSIRKELPIFIMSGDADPVGNYGKGIWKTAHYYRSVGLKDLKVMLFAGGRHELLNEINKDEVYETIYEWITRKINKL